jgi:hypothetical protein
MSDKDQDLVIEDIDLELGEGDEQTPALPEEEGFDLEVSDDLSIDFLAPEELPDNTSSSDEGMELSLDDELSLDENAPETNDLVDFGEVSLEDTDSSDGESGLSLSESDSGLSDEALAKLKEIDEMMGGDDHVHPPMELSEDNDDDLSLEDSADIAVDLSADDDNGDIGFDLSAAIDSNNVTSKETKTNIDETDSAFEDEVDFGISYTEEAVDVEAVSEVVENDINTSLVTDDLNLDTLNFGSDEPEISKNDEPVREEKKSPARDQSVTLGNDRNKDFAQDLKEISTAYSGEMERMQATISNLRTDRDELLDKIQKLEEERMLQNRQSLTMRAELDEKKIELSIIRKKLNEEINELKDRLKFHDEKKLILEEKNRILMVELDKAAQKNKIDVKKVQMRERELEQRLELLKSDAETQIRNRDLKILELKRKIDAMEFDMESISVQEKRSVESRFELEDKLDKAIKTLRTAISVLEDESDQSSALEALKKNIDM